MWFILQEFFLDFADFFLNFVDFEFFFRFFLVFFRFFLDFPRFFLDFLDLSYRKLEKTRKYETYKTKTVV